MMRLACLLVLLLCSCAPTDPDAMIAAGQAMKSAAQQTQARAIIDATRQAMERERLATQAAQATAQYQAGVSTSAAWTAQAMDAQLTAGAATTTAGVATYEQSKAIQNYEQQVQLQRTTSALTVSRAETAANLAAFGWSAVIFAAFTAVFSALVVVVTWGYSRWAAAYIQVQASKVLPPPRAPQLIEGSAHEADINTEAIDMLVRAERMTAPTSNIIPRWDKLGYSSPHVRQRVVDRMRLLGMVAVDSDHTLIKREYGSVAGLLQAFREGKAGLL